MINICNCKHYNCLFCSTKNLRLRFLLAAHQRTNTWNGHLFSLNFCFNSLNSYETTKGGIKESNLLSKMFSINSCFGPMSPLCMVWYCKLPSLCTTPDTILLIRKYKFCNLIPRNALNWHCELEPLSVTATAKHAVSRHVNECNPCEKQNHYRY